MKILLQLIVPLYYITGIYINFLFQPLNTALVIAEPL